MSHMTPGAHILVSDGGSAHGLKMNCTAQPPPWRPSGTSTCAGTNRSPFQLARSERFRLQGARELQRCRGHTGRNSAPPENEHRAGNSRGSIWLAARGIDFGDWYQWYGFRGIGVSKGNRGNSSL